jgi:hypothetical protein
VQLHRKRRRRGRRGEGKGRQERRSIAGVERGEKDNGRVFPSLNFSVSGF